MKKIVCLMWFVWAPHAFCANSTDVLQAQLNAHHTMTARFQQVVFVKKREVSRASGNMALSRPGRFRWQTLQPMAQLVIADGHQLWVYDVDLEQVSVKKQDSNLGATAALFLNNDTSYLARDFNVTLQTKGSRKDFNLVAKSAKANFQRVILHFTNKVLSGLELFDQLGQRTDIHFSGVKLNQTVSPSLFQFHVPKGVDVVQQ
jgi:outer membrane lipoprotein carrier protein